MHEHEQAFRERGAQLAAIGLGDRRYAQLFREEAGISFSLLIDEELVAYQAAELRSASLLHILRSDNSAALKRARAAGHRQLRNPLAIASALTKKPFQLGGSFVFGPGNVDRYVHLSETFGDNASIADLLAALP